MPATSKSLRKADREALAEQVQSALIEARAAAKAAYESYLASHAQAPDQMADAGGGASVVAYKLSPKLRDALKEIEAISPRSGSGWIVSNFTSGIATQPGLAGQEKACSAAADVLGKRLGEFGEFVMSSQID